MSFFRSCFGSHIGRLTVAALALFSLPLEIAHAGSALDFSIYQPYVNTRILGMGGAFVAVADDRAALFYNPAGLSRLTENNYYGSLGFGLDSKVLKLQSDLSKGSDDKDVDGISTLLNQNFGEYYASRIPTISAFYSRPRWAFAIIPADLTTILSIHKFATLDVVATNDTTIALGRGWDVYWGTDRVSVGVTLKTIHRTYFNKSVIASDLAFGEKIIRNEDATEGVTVDMDLGILWTPRAKERGWRRLLNPTSALAVRNVADWGFSGTKYISEGSGIPPKLERRFDLGMMWELPDWWVWKTRMAADVRDMGHRNWTFAKGSHFGLEFLWKMAGWWQGGWRAGLSQGYFTAGFTGTFGVFTLDLATYAEEMGPSTSNYASRRYLLQTSFDW